MEYTRSQAVIGSMMLIDKMSCRIADKIILVGRDMAATLQKRFRSDMPRYCIINNWIDEKQIYPLPAGDRRSGHLNGNTDLKASSYSCIRGI